ncbi:PEP-CTERM sorting domain-containing protein [Nostoc sp. UHCC 0302]|uniref:PEP-CTERM sorting domain-containing protein n=1 Tax=Nostoc sp. UHCC 0302 TaxID=3134896 RepID=UPI00311CCB84
MKNAIKLGVAITVSAIAWVGVAVRADAAKVNIVNNNASSIEDLQIGNKLYNVNFVQDSAINLFDPTKSTSTPLFEDTDALTAVNAITNVLNSLTPVATLAGGNSTLFVPIGPYDSGLITEFSSSYDSGQWDLDERTAFGYPQPIGSEISLNYATFTFTKSIPTAVPEPSDILGSIAAVGLLIAMKRKMASSESNRI